MPLAARTLYLIYGDDDKISFFKEREGKGSYYYVPESHISDVPFRFLLISTMYLWAGEGDGRGGWREGDEI
jgi:hypothetical protein